MRVLGEILPIGIQKSLQNQWPKFENGTFDVLCTPRPTGSAVRTTTPKGVLLWLDVDARLRELSHGERGIDDFARVFFAKDSAQPTRTYTFQDVCDALDKVAPDDWAAFLNRHLHSHSADEAIAGLARAGWKLVYTDTPTETFRLHPMAPFGGVKCSGMGVEFNVDGLKEYTTVQVVNIAL